MQLAHRAAPGRGLIVSAGLAASLAAAMIGIFLVAPEEVSMGPPQRIVYVHVAVAWFGLVGYLTAAAAGAIYLWRRDLAWDDWAHAAAEVGWLCSTLTLLTGSLWAHEAWNTWWTWDPRLTTALILWMVYAGYFLLRSSVDDRRRRARYSAVLSLVGALDVPLVVMATKWFRGLHPVAPRMEPTMHAVLMFSVVVFTFFMAYMIVFRRGQLAQARQIESCERLADLHT